MRKTLAVAALSAGWTVPPTPHQENPMRKILATAVLGAGLATALLPAAPANAYCDALTSAITGGCSNPCTVVASAYYAADEAGADLLPDVEFICFM